MSALLLLAALTSNCWFFDNPPLTNTCINNNLVSKYFISMVEANKVLPLSYDNILALLQKQQINKSVIAKTLSTLKCAEKFNLDHKHILTIIDYSLPSNKKRLWIFDLDNNELLFNTYVSHGITSGSLFTEYFSNKNNSKASSLGIYKTNKTYYGRHGLSLRLEGLDNGFNDRAEQRAIVMHGGWYVNEDFIKKYGRAGRSWGCPALPTNITTDIINKIKNDALMVVYYPTETWFHNSKYLTCQQTLAKKPINKHEKPFAELSEVRDDVLLTTHNKLEYILTMPADFYVKLFQKEAPLTRMLRRKVNEEEHIALSSAEFQHLANFIMQFDLKNEIIKTATQKILSKLYLVTPKVKHIGGYNKTIFEIKNFGKIEELKFTANNVNSLSNASNASDTKNMNDIANTAIKIPEQSAEVYTVNFEKILSIKLHTSNKFIRWLGL